MRRTRAGFLVGSTVGFVAALVIGASLSFAAMTSPTEMPTEEATAQPSETEAPPTEAPPTEAPPTEAPPTEAPPTEAPPTEAPPTEGPPTEAPPTEAPPAATDDAPPADRDRARAAESTVHSVDGEEPGPPAGRGWRRDDHPVFGDGGKRAGEQPGQRPEAATQR